MKLEEYLQKYSSDPVIFNARYQAQGKYPGIDPLHNETVPKGTLLAALEIEGATYYIKAEDLLNHNMGVSAVDIAASCMVQPWLKDDYQDTASYRFNIRVYELKEDIEMAVGPITENPQFGSGKNGQLDQYVLPNGNEISKEGIKQALEGKADGAKMIPVCLAEPERYERHKNQKLIEALAEAYKDNIDHNKTVDSQANKDYGCICAENEMISRQVYDVIDLKADINMALHSQNCAKMDYIREIQKPEHKQDKEYLSRLDKRIKRYEDDIESAQSKLKRDINDLKQYPEHLHTFSKAHSNLTKDIDHLKNTAISEDTRQITDLSDIPNLYEYALQRDLQLKALGQEGIMKPLSDEYKNHLLNSDNWTSERITQHKEYLDKKTNALENGLSFQEDKAIEADLQRVYDAITAEADIEGFFTNRDMLYTAEANTANREYLLRLTMQCNLKEAMGRIPQESAEYQEAQKVYKENGERIEQLKARSPMGNNFDDKISMMEQRLSALEKGKYDYDLLSREYEDKLCGRENDRTIVIDRSYFALQKETERLTEGYALTRYDLISQKIDEIDKELKYIDKDGNENIKDLNGAYPDPVYGEYLKARKSYMEHCKSVQDEKAPNWTPKDGGGYLLRREPKEGEYQIEARTEQQLRSEIEAQGIKPDSAMIKAIREMDKMTGKKYSLLEICEMAAKKDNSMNPCVKAQMDVVVKKISEQELVSEQNKQTRELIERKQAELRGRMQEYIEELKAASKGLDKMVRDPTIPHIMKPKLNETISHLKLVEQKCMETVSKPYLEVCKKEPELHQEVRGELLGVSKLLKEYEGYSGLVQAEVEKAKWQYKECQAELDSYQRLQKDLKQYPENLKMKEQSESKIFGKRSFTKKYAEQIAECKRVEAEMAKLGIKSPEELTGKIATVEGRMKELTEQIKFRKLPLRLQIQSTELVRSAERCLSKGKEPKVLNNLTNNIAKPKRAIAVEK